MVYNIILNQCVCYKYIATTSNWKKNKLIIQKHSSIKIFYQIWYLNIMFGDFFFHNINNFMFYYIIYSFYLLAKVIVAIKDITYS